MTDVERLEAPASDKRQARTYSTKRLTVIISATTFNDMVEQQTHPLNSVFHALGDATRRGMLRQLAGGEQSVGQLAEPFSMSLAAASKHIKALEGAGLLRREVRGRTHLCKLEPGPLGEAHGWLSAYARFWNGRLDVLENLLREEDAGNSLTTKGDPR